ncbi:MAG: NUDIX hydrolase [Deltaproteobacteria bacterium]
MKDLLTNPRGLMEHISKALQEKSLQSGGFPEDVFHSPVTSSVLFLLGGHCNGSSEPCVVFNKRSFKVRQPGDLCFPGGRVSPRLDSLFSKVLKSPFSPLARWRFWPLWQEHRRAQADRLSLLLATSLRESVEEMRLNPFGVTFLGPMPAEDLLLFRRVLYPMVVWINRQKRFLPNWEVEKIVHVPVRELLNPEAYACYRLRFKGRRIKGEEDYVQDFPCFCHGNETQREVLWGATFRIVMSFLKTIFGFSAPSTDSLPVIYNTLNERYWNGSS